MKNSLLFFLLFCQFNVKAQSAAGITGKPDTSFTIYQEYRKVQKTFPGITVVKEYHSKSIIETRNIGYCTTGNRKLWMDAFYPSAKAKEKRTAILIIHGGGWLS